MFERAFEGINVFEAVPMAVMTLPKESGMGWPASFVQRRFGIEQIEVARPAFHEEPDHGFCRGWIVRFLRSEWIQRVDEDILSFASEAIQAKQIGQSERAESASGPI